MKQAAIEKRAQYESGSRKAPAKEVQHEPRGISWRDFVQVAKPGIIISNLITTFGGFWIASKWDIDWLLLLWTLLGTTLVMASGCVLNNYLDRELDTKMERTRERALPSGILTPGIVLGYGILLGLAGMAVLGFLVNGLAAVLGLAGVVFYVGIYTAWLKRTSVWSTVVGAISGAMPPVIGYAAISGRLDEGALILFMILFLWQPPHFWALGIRRLEEYRTAGYPLLPVVKGVNRTKVSMMRYVIPLVPVSVLLYVYDFVGVFYLIASTVLGLIWVYLCAKGFRAKDEERWAKGVFVYSINYLTLLFIVMVLDTIGR